MVRQERLQLLAKSLYVVAGMVLVVGVIAGIYLLSSDADAFLIGEVQEDNRTFSGFASILGGITSAGVLAALGGILDLLLSRDANV
jgi:hypothetical protein